MSGEDTQSSGDNRGGDRRGGDRRRRERRKSDRRTPPPWWRRPAALVAYGVVGTLAIVLIVGRIGSAEDEAPRQIANGAPSAAELPPPPEEALGEAQPAFTSADYDRLMVEGDAASGRLIQVELFCEGVQAMPVRAVDDPDPRIAERVDDGGRISGAQCRWGRRGEDRREDFFLIIPSDHADDFAAAPIVADGFVRRRHVIADVEWIGRSDELSLRTGGVLRRMVGQRGP